MNLPPDTQLTLIRKDVEINGRIIHAGRVAALNQGIIYRLAAEGMVSEVHQDIERALQHNSEIIDPFAA